MADLNETPRANRLSIAFFGLRNAGKSTLVNAFTNQPLAIVSDTPGTTTDPVSKAMEILPLGPCLVTDTAGLDDVGALGEARVEKSLAVLATADVAVWVWGETADESSPWYRRFVDACAARHVAMLVYRRGDVVEDLKKKIAALNLVDETPDLLDGLVREGERVVAVCPIDESAPKGRLILPQVQVIRACLDRHVTCEVCQVEELPLVLQRGGDTLVVTDSQAFRAVSKIVDAARAAANGAIRLTSFSILFARQKGDVAAFFEGLRAARCLKAGARVLIAEGCTHHRQCNDIGMTKIPKALEKISGATGFDLSFASGAGFPLDGSVDLIVQCGGCMLTRREMMRRIGLARASGVPIVNYGLLLAGAAGLLGESDAIIC